jgi:hypothetical protein
MWEKGAEGNALMMMSMFCVSYQFLRYTLTYLLGISYFGILLFEKLPLIPTAQLYKPGIYIYIYIYIYMIFSNVRNSSIRKY